MIPTQVTPNRQNYVEIGKIYENLVTEVVFSVPDLGDGTGSYTVVFQRPKEAAPYPVAARVEFPNVIWEVGAADTAKSGTGKAEVRWYGDGGEVGKSKTFVVRVNAGLADPTDAPEPWEGYVGRVARNAETAETAAADAATSAQSAGADAVKAEAALKALEDGIASGDFRGEDGAVPNIQIGTVTTLPAGSNATASMGGTAENPLLNLGIPKGADGQGSGSGGTDISLGLTSATVGQTIKVKAVDADGKPTEWEAAETGEKWEKIAEIIIPDDAEESNALTINKDMNGQPFELLKATLLVKFPKYIGETTIPKITFSMLNGRSSGTPSPAFYTSIYPAISKTESRGVVWEIDVSGAFMVESRWRSSISWGDPSRLYYGIGTDGFNRIVTDSLWAKPITSIGGVGMLIYPGCKFILYGVRA